MRVIPYLTFNGQCEAAFKLYEKCLEGKILMMMTYAESPMAEQAPDGWRDKIVHTTLAVGDSLLQGADVLPEKYQRPQGFTVSVNPGSTELAERIFNSLAEDGSIQFPIQKTFWSLRFGAVTDRFGIPWAINCEIPA